MQSEAPDPVADAADATQPDQVSFADLGLDDKVLQALRDVGYESPVADPGRDHPAAAGGPRRRRPGADRHRQDRRVRAADPVAASTSTQKTPQALVLAPTRELALQVAEAFSATPRTCPGLHVLPIYGGQGYGVQLSGLRRGAQVVVGTPGRVIDHLEKGTLDLSRAALPGARRGRRDAADGLRRGRRDASSPTPRRTSRSRCSPRPCRRDPPDHQEVPARPGRDHRQVQDRDRGEHHAALHPGRRTRRRWTR